MNKKKTLDFDLPWATIGNVYVALIMYVHRQLARPKTKGQCIRKGAAQNKRPKSLRRLRASRLPNLGKAFLSPFFHTLKKLPPFNTVLG
jgi:hypothetical protein